MGQLRSLGSYQIATRKEIVVAMDWAGFGRDG
jgi:hypothetical protein